MIIHYSPYFDSGYYIDFSNRSSCMVNESVVGNTGLLAELELRGGLSRRHLSPTEREANYYNLMKSYIRRHPGCFIQQSFDVDEFGVASELLHWRDELVLCGWNRQVTGISDKLNLL